MYRRQPFELLGLLLATGALSGPAGCGPHVSGPVAADPAAYPTYAAEDALLFDDSAAVEIFGLAIEADSSDRLLESRIRRADSVLHVKIATVTRENDAISLTFRPMGEALAGDPAADPIDLLVTNTNRIYPLVRNAGESLLGRSLILIFRRFNDQGTIVTHWRAEPDTARVRAKVARARAMRDVSGY